MAEVGVQEPCKSLAGGDSLETSGWQPRADEEEVESGRCHRRESAGKVGDCQQAGGGDWRLLGKKRHRRRPSKKKRRWKPYNKLTWEEKKRLEERESQRAAKMRAEMFAKGQPVAPYNTTQFLMDDHAQEEPDLCPPPPPRRALPGSSTEDEAEEDEDGSGSEGSQDGADFLEKDFSETYEKYHAESLQDMSKAELLREYLELEKCLSRMEDSNNRRIRELEMELEKVKEENRRLRRERGQLLDD